MILAVPKAFERFMTAPGSATGSRAATVDAGAAIPAWFTGNDGTFSPTCREHVTQKWAPVLRFSNMRHQKGRACCVNAKERDTR